MLLATLPAAVVGIFYVSYSAGNALHERATRQVADQTRELAAAAERWDEYLHNALDSISGMPSMRSTERERQTAALAHLQHVYNRLTFVARVNLDGQGVSGGAGTPGDFSHESWFRDALQRQKIVRQRVPAGACGHFPSVIYASPIYSEDRQLVGVLAAGTSLPALSEQVGARQIGSSGYSMLVDDQGNIVAHPSEVVLSSAKNTSEIPVVNSLVAGRAAGEQRFIGATAAPGWRARCR